MTPEQRKAWGEKISVAKKGQNSGHKWTSEEAAVQGRRGVEKRWDEDFKRQHPEEEFVDSVITGTHGTELHS